MLIYNTMKREKEFFEKKNITKTLISLFVAPQFMMMLI